MSDRMLHVSRRRLLQLAGIAPLAALAEGGASTAALAQAAQQCAGIPEEPEMKSLVTLAQDYSKNTLKKTLDETKFRLVASILWRYYCEGAHPEAEVPAAGLNDVLIAAFNKTGGKGRPSGYLIVDNLDKWDALQHEPTTNACAFRAGHHTRKYAQKKDPNKPKQIDKDSFGKGWDDAEKDMTTFMSRLRRRKHEPKPGDGEAHTEGFGC